MNDKAYSPLHPLSESLTALTRYADSSALRAHLLGRGLPALGGNSEPAETILRALGEVPDPRQLASDLAPTLARLISESVIGIEDFEGDLPPVLKFLLLQALQLAADLPADAHLSLSLERMVSELARKVRGFWQQDPLAPPAVRALVHQQVDARAERLWYHLLKDSGQGPLSPQQRTVLMYAWRGLLYIPPDVEAKRVGRVLNIERIEAGLLSLEAGVRSRDGGSRLVIQALGILAETFPRSPQFWAKSLGPLLSRWPVALQESVLHQWPDFGHGTISYAEAQLMYEEQEERFKTLIEERDSMNASLQAENRELRLQMDELRQRHNKSSNDRTFPPQENDLVKERNREANFRIISGSGSGVALMPRFRGDRRP